MLTETLISLFDRELNKLKREIGLYQEEQMLWVIDNNITNSAGNLAMHLVGNLRLFIGKELGATDYTRNRDLEFSIKNLPKAELLEKIETTHLVVLDALTKLDAQELSKEYPLEVFGHKMTTEYFLIHLLAHLTYHLGQINYHRRLLTKNL